MNSYKDFLTNLKGKVVTANRALTTDMLLIRDDKAGEKIRIINVHIDFIIIEDLNSNRIITYPLNKVICYLESL